MEAIRIWKKSMFLIIDNCVLMDLAESRFFLIEKLRKLVLSGQVRVVLPEIVAREWERNKSSVRGRIENRVSDARDALSELAAYAKESGKADFVDFVAKFSSRDLSKVGANVASKRIELIDVLLASALRIPASDQARLRAVELALERQAPFAEKNSMADALIFLSAVEWVRAENIERSVFVTHDRDFVDKSRSKKSRQSLSPELASIAEGSGLRYENRLGEVLNEVEKSIVSASELAMERAILSGNERLDAIWESFERSRRAEFTAVLEAVKADQARRYSQAAASIRRWQKEKLSALVAEASERVDRAVRGAFAAAASSVPTVGGAVATARASRRPVEDKDPGRKPRDENDGQ